MKLVAEQGLWTVGPAVPEPPTVAVLEVAGAVLAWPVDDPAAGPRLTFTDVRAADWLWRVTGEAGHVAVLQALQDRPADAQASIDIADLELSATALEPLRRLAFGHWLRRWWPASVRDGIADLDMAVLDAELALLTDAAQAFFVEDTLDSDIGGLLRPHRDAFAVLLRGGDARVTALVESCLEIADWADVAEPEDIPSGRRRDDYALAAGAPAPSAAQPIGRSTTSISWSAVPPGIFDAAEDTVDWAIHPDGAGAAVLTVRTETLAPAGGVPVGLRAGDLTAVGVLDADGTAGVTLPISESAAWNHDWSAAVLTVGVAAEGETGETRQVRDRLRALVRNRLGGAADAFLAEVLAAESDY